MWPFNKIARWIKERLGDSRHTHYYSTFNGYWAGNLPILVFVPAMKRDTVKKGFDRWAKDMKKLGITWTFVDSPGVADIICSFSANKPHEVVEGVDYGEKWSVTTTEGRTAGEPWRITKASIVFWNGLNAGDLVDSAAHEFIHTQGVTRHSDDPEDVGYQEFGKGKNPTKADVKTIEMGITVRKKADDESEKQQ